MTQDERDAQEERIKKYDELKREVECLRKLACGGPGRFGIEINNKVIDSYFFPQSTSMIYEAVNGAIELSIKAIEYEMERV